MRNLKKVVLVMVALVIVGVLLVTGFPSAAQDKSQREVYQAQAMGQNTQAGKTFNVTINIAEYSTEEERQVLIDAFNKAGSRGLYNALDKMPAKGRIAITGTLGYDIHFVRKLPKDDGFELRVVTNRPINIGEAWYNGRSVDYNLSVLQLDLNKKTGEGSGILLPATKFTIDKKTGELTMEAFRNPWTLVNIMDRTKD